MLKILITFFSNASKTCVSEGGGGKSLHQFDVVYRADRLHEFFENLENLENIVEKYPLKIVLKIEKFRKFENCDFSIFNMIFNGNFQNYIRDFLEIFGIFKNFEIF